MKAHSSCHPAAPPHPHKPDTKENHVAVMRYTIDFLMKHNIAFSCPWFFCYHTHSHIHIHTQRGRKINTIQYALQSQTPSNLSALGFKVRVFAYFGLDCCHFVIFVILFYITKEMNFHTQSGNS